VGSTLCFIFGRLVICGGFRDFRVLMRRSEEVEWGDVIEIV
jgi:hypothetical protein